MSLMGWQGVVLIVVTEDSQCCHSTRQRSLHLLLNLLARSDTGYLYSYSIGKSKNRDLPNLRWGGQYNPTVCLEGERARMYVGTNVYIGKNQKGTPTNANCKSNKTSEGKEEVFFPSYDNVCR